MRGRLGTGVTALLVAALILGVTWFVADVARESRKHDVRRSQLAEATTIRVELQNSLNEHFAMTNILRTIAVADPDITQEGFRRVIAGMGRQPRDTLIMALVREGTPLMVYPESPRESAEGWNLLRGPLVRETAREAMQKDISEVREPTVTILPDIEHLVYLSPIFTRRRGEGEDPVPWGLGILVIDLHRLIAGVDMGDFAADRIALRLRQGRTGGRTLVYGDEELFARADSIVTEVNTSHSIEQQLFPLHWEVAVYPFYSSEEERRTLLLVWGIGSVVALLSACLTYKMLTELGKRRRAQSDLKASEKRLQDVVQASSDWIWEMDANSRLVYMSERFTDMTGIELERILGLYRPAYSPAVEEQKGLGRIEELMREQKPFRNCSYEAWLPGRGVAYLRSSGIPLYDENGTFSGYRGTTTDITAEIEAEQRAMQAERRLYNAVESMHDGLALFDSEKRLQVFNQRFAGFLQEYSVSRDITLGDFLETIIDPDAAGSTELLAQIGSQPMPVSPLECRLRSGQWISFRFKVTQEREIFSIWTDISERKRHEEERSALEEELRQAQKLEAIGTLAGGIAHEINTPTQYVGDNLRFMNESFAGIAQFVALARTLSRKVRDGEAAEEAASAFDEHCRTIEIDYLLEEIPAALDQSLQGIAQVSRIVKAMKEFAHPVNAESGPADLNKALENTVAVCRNEWKHVAAIEWDLDPDLPLVECQLGEINQVFLSLIVNAAHAVEAADRGMGTITLRSRHDGSWVDISVEDTGTGIPVKIRERIFDMFFTTKSVGKGSGQGLTIARDIVQRRHHGSIRVESTEGAGSTFIVRLPIEKPSKNTENAS